MVRKKNPDRPQNGRKNLEIYRKKILGQFVHDDGQSAFGNVQEKGDSCEITVKMLLMGLECPDAVGKGMVC